MTDDERIQVTLDLAGALLVEAADEERAHVAADSAMSTLERLGCAVLRAAERQQAADWAGWPGLSGTGD